MVTVSLGIKKARNKVHFDILEECHLRIDCTIPSLTSTQQLEEAVFTENS